MIAMLIGLTVIFAVSVLGVIARIARLAAVIICFSNLRGFNLWCEALFLLEQLQFLQI